MARTTTTSRLHASCEAFNSLCEKCVDERKGLEGIFVMQPIKRSWTYDRPELKHRPTRLIRLVVASAGLVVCTK